MAFQDVIDDYGNGQTGTIEPADGPVGYTITATADTITRPNTTRGAQVTADGKATVEVAFDNPVCGVPRRHRILVASRLVRRICGQGEVLIPDFRRVGLPVIGIARAIRPVSHHHVLPDGHDLVLANGAPAETLFLCPISATALQDELEDTVPEMCLKGDLPAMTPAGPFPTATAARKIVVAHERHRRPLLETRPCVSA